jgi:C-terminal processing protease CtpA/Prc
VAPETDIRKGIAVLQETLTYLDSTLVSDLANGNPYLRGRWHDIYYDMAIAYAKLKDKKETLLYLERMADAGSFSGVVDWLEGKKPFDFIRQDPAYRQIINRLRAQGEFWEYKALRTPYRENLPEDEKIAGLSLLWTMARQNFVFFDRVPHLNWDSLYLSLIPKVRETKSTLEYYLLLQRMCAQLADGHTNVYVPAELAGQVYGRPPLRTALVEDRVIVIQVNSDSLRKSGIVPGTEITRIDGVPVKEYARERVAPYQSGSTPQDHDVRTYGYFLLAGPEDQPVALELRDAKGKPSQRTLPRKGYGAAPKPPVLDFKVLKGKIAYVALNSFENKKIVTAFDSLFSSIGQTDGLILDVRNNGGGNGDYGYQLLGYLTDKPFKLSRWKSLVYQPVLRAWGIETQWVTSPAEEAQPNGKRLYTRPVVVLLGPRSFSAAEDFLVAFDAMDRGKLMGEASGGSTGQPLSFSLPGGGSARVCSKWDSYPDGKEFVGVGVVPDVLVKPTVKDIQTGRDPVVEEAVKYLRTAGIKASHAGNKP